MHKISYTYTNKAKIILYLMITALCLLRLTILAQIKLYHLQNYEVYLLPTILYYFVIIALLTALFFGYKFFYVLYDEKQVAYCNVLTNRRKEMPFSAIRFARFDRRGIYLYEEAAPAKDHPSAFFIPFFRLGIAEAISVNAFFEKLLDTEGIRVEKHFKVLPGYGKPWRLLSLLYAFLAFCLLIIAMEPLYTVIVLFQSFS